MAPRAGEIIHEAAIAMRTGMFTGRLAKTVHAYPTWSTAVRQAAAQLFFEIGGRSAKPTAETSEERGRGESERGNGHIDAEPEVSMPVTTSAGTDHQVTTSVARSANVAGRTHLAQPSDVEGQLATGSFTWLDLENPDADRLQAFGHSLRLDDDTIQRLAEGSQRPAFARVGDSMQAVVPAMNPGRSAGDLLGIQVVFTDRFLLTAHSEPCPALDAVYRRYDDLTAEKKADGPSVLFLVLDGIVDTFEPALLALDRHLDELQVVLLGRAPGGVQDHSEVHNSLCIARRILSEVVQALGWYLRDLHYFVGNAQLPGVGPAAEPLFDQHRTRVTTLRDASRDYRDESQDALGQVAANVSGRQGELINVLTVVATVFLPLTFITGYFGMDFGILTSGLNSDWVFVVLGIALPVACVIIPVALFKRLATRLHVKPVLETLRYHEALSQGTNSSGRR